MEKREEFKFGVRYNQGKPRMELIPTELIEEVAKVLTFGAEKYDDYNWQKFTPKQRGECVGSLMRHIEAYRKGEKLDPESGLSHLAHAGCNIAFLLWYENNPYVEQI